MEGCRGDADVLEKKVWAFIAERRRGKATEVIDAAATDARRTELLAEAKRLRELARALLEKARELEDAAGE